MPRPLLIVALGAALFTARILGAHFGSFFGADEISLAAGAAALVTDSLSGI